MGLDLVGRPGIMAEKMNGMDSKHGNIDSYSAVHPRICNVGDHDGGDAAAYHDADFAQL